jgi:hypothetical protein
MEMMRHKFHHFHDFHKMRRIKSKGDSETMNDATYNVLVKIAQALEEIAEHLEVISNELNGDSNG